MADFRFLAVSFPVFSLDIARYAIGKVRENLLAINMEISTKSNDRFGINEIYCAMFDIVAIKS